MNRFWCQQFVSIIRLGLSSFLLCFFALSFFSDRAIAQKYQLEVLHSADIMGNLLPCN